MKIFDAHIHARKKEPNPELLIKDMNKVGVYGGCVFSTRPLEVDISTGLNFKDRLNEIINWTEKYPNRLFPVLWIHPYEFNIFNKIKIAVNAGVKAFKIICTDFYPYERRCLKVLDKIADNDKAVFFHSGIIWNVGDASKYNRPLNFEKLIEIDNLKFAMGHCGWPWTDECIALYGKFLNGITSGRSAEMFFDLTPGTPEIYREDLIKKIFNCGYDVPNNILFGTDNNASDYKYEWTEKWLKVDGQIYDKLGVDELLLTKIYSDNLLRFLGLKEKDFIHISPNCNDADTWSLENYKLKK